MSGREPHDELFRTLLADPVSLRSLVRRYAPKALMPYLLDTPPKLLEGTLVRPGGGKLQADGIVEVALVGDPPMRAHLLFEHLSGPEPELPRRMLEYVVAHWRRPGAPGQPRPAAIPVIPLALVHGPRTARTPASIGEGLKTPPGLAQEVPFVDVLIVLHRLDTIPPDDLADDPATRAALHALTLSRVEDPPPAALAAVRRDLCSRPETCLVRQKGLEYILRLLRANNEALLAWLEMEDKEARDMAKMTLTELIGQQIRDEILEQDREKWRVAERGEALLELLAERYGQVPGEVAERVSSAGLNELRVWFKEALRSPDLDGVFRTAR